ncbi:MAG: hypothetical protein AB8I08_08430 [Sandaracinaceae bacterium]
MQDLFSRSTALPYLLRGLVVAAVGLAGVACDFDGGTGGDGGTSDAWIDPNGPDEDGDGIVDAYEGRDADVDTDGDGIPDWQDTDSDNDGVSDADEAGVNPSTGEPADTDGDGVYDFRDEDADDNGIPDADEPDRDYDSDRVRDGNDIDDDGDQVDDRDEIGDPDSPTDTDGDGVPDYLDEDSDGDTILDVHEANRDTDEDGDADRVELDSDRDGYPDAEEAGDSDPGTPPVDSDGDLTPDYRDSDSDGDGLSDVDEREAGTDRLNPDTDGDGVLDVVEVVACADASCVGDATDPESSPRTRGDFVFTEPFMAPPSPPRDTLAFATELQDADVYFLVDTSASMGAAIENLRESLSTPTTGVIAQVRAEIPNTWFGVGGFEDYRALAYGSEMAGDRAYYHVQDLTESIDEAQTAVGSLVTHRGGDTAESGFAAGWSAVTGMGLPGASGWNESRASATGFSPCATGRFGWPCFREGAFPILVIVTDAPMHNGPGGDNAYDDGAIGGATPTYDELVAALTETNVRVVGVSVGVPGATAARPHLEAVARATGAISAGDRPLVSDATSGQVGSSVVQHVRTLANSTPIDVSIAFLDDPSDDVETFAAFVDHIEANEDGDPSRGCAPRTAYDEDGDGWRETFRAVTPGEPVCFDIIVKQNDTVPAEAEPQLYGADLQLLGDGFTELDRRRVTFLVPAEARVPDLD